MWVSLCLCLRFGRSLEMEGFQNGLSKGGWLSTPHSPQAHSRALQARPAQGYTQGDEMHRQDTAVDAL